MELQSEIYHNRREMKLSQADLGERLGVSETIVNQWEQGEKYPTVENLIDLSNVFEISLDQLIRGTEQTMYKVDTTPHHLNGWDFFGALLVANFCSRWIFILDFKSFFIVCYTN
ncbi:MULTISPECIES: helix-turn-helix transcriptional regulator [Pediococcus]|uniref:helix-turn-helix domain-containing protein n=1 Tax=Pediococcus TaxID=1253 RepID=UPI0021A57DA7|nr:MULTISPECIES: helix-turn-helix transcriptional regulator [Pediococcus]